MKMKNNDKSDENDKWRKIMTNLMKLEVITMTPRNDLVVKKEKEVTRVLVAQKLDEFCPLKHKLDQTPTSHFVFSCNLNSKKCERLKTSKS